MRTPCARLLLKRQSTQMIPLQTTTTACTQPPPAPIPHTQHSRPGGTPVHETGITSRAQPETHTTSRAQAETDTTSRPNPAPNTINPSTQSNRRPVGTKPSRRAARDTVTGFLQTDTTSRAQPETHTTSRQNPAPNTTNPSSQSNTPGSARDPHDIPAKSSPQYLRSSCPPPANTNPPHPTLPSRRDTCARDRDNIPGSIRDRHSIPAKSNPQHPHPTIQTTQRPSPAVPPHARNPAYPPIRLQNGHKHPQPPPK